MKDNQVNQNRHWKSIEHLENEAQFNEMAEQEFKSSPLSADEGNDGVARRDFLKLMGASIAMSATACVRRPVEKIVPYAKRPEDLTIGVANFYASSLSDELSGYGLVVRTREGRPIKLEANTDNPASPKGISARAQAHCISLYDLDRLKQPKRRIADAGKDFHKRNWDLKSWEKVDDEVVALLGAGNTLFFTNNIASPSKSALIKDFLSAFGGKHYSWNPVVDSNLVSAQASSYGKAVRPKYRFEKADYILNVGLDFLGTDANAHEYASAYASRRTPGEGMSKHVCFESLLSLTGMNSDDRIRVKSSQYVDVLMGLAHEIIVKLGNSKYASNSSVKAALANYADTASNLGIDSALFSQIAKDLWAKRGKSIVVTGGVSGTTESGESAHIAANFLNSVLGNDGVSVDYAKSNYTGISAEQSDLENFVKELNSTSSKLAIIEGVNPAYNSSAAAGFEKAISTFRDAGGLVVYMGLYEDETARLADMILPIDHSLEAWGDAEFHNGVFSLQQPTIRPLHKSRSLEQSLLNWAYMAEKGVSRLQNSETYHDYVKSYWKTDILKNSKSGKSFEDFWFELLQSGVYAKSKNTSGNMPSRSFRTAALSKVSSKKNSGYELELYTKYGTGDGSYANIAWLQEFPDPVSKIAWDNYLTVSKATADKHGLKDGDVVVLEANGQKMDVPVYMQVGQHDDVFGLALGYGRSAAGKVGNGVGVDAYKFAAFANAKPVFAGIQASIKKTEKKYKLANTQGHNHMLGRQISVETTLESYKKDKSSGLHKHKIFSAWDKFEYKSYKWAMSVDLNSCIGCGSCVIACQAENNIPVVGKEYVLEGREMHWMRIDRYYSGNTDNPDNHFIPVMCQHCDNAPCETVCPVVATTHSEEGINEMTYNRCVGTRYCANNCPYKVRRFNWFAYTKGDRVEDTPKEAYNPRVTVRSRGVMEKCSYCIQRIKDAKNIAKNNGVAVKDGDVVTACEQGCPTGAIQFGDMNNPESRVSKAFKSERTYSLLEEYNAVPSVRYMTKVRNAKRDNNNHDGEGHH